MKILRNFGWKKLERKKQGSFIRSHIFLRCYMTYALPISGLWHVQGYGTSRPIWNKKRSCLCESGHIKSLSFQLGQQAPRDDQHAGGSRAAILPLMWGSWGKRHRIACPEDIHFVPQR